MIQNISMATDDDIIHIGDDVNIYPVYLSNLGQLLYEKIILVG